MWRHAGVVVASPGVAPRSVTYGDRSHEFSGPWLQICGESAQSIIPYLLALVVQQGAFSLFKGKRGQGGQGRREGSCEGRRRESVSVCVLAPAGKSYLLIRLTNLVKNEIAGNEVPTCRRPRPHHTHLLRVKLHILKQMGPRISTIELWDILLGVFL